MSLLLTRSGLLGRLHHAAETKAPVRTGLLTATASAAGLTMGRVHAHKKGPLIAAGGGALLSFMGFSAIGDGLAASGATLIGYRTGVKMARKAAPVMTTAPIAAVMPPGAKRRMKPSFR